MSVEEYINRGIERRDSNNYNGAISDFSAAIRIKPDYDFDYFQRAYAKDELKNYSSKLIKKKELIVLNKTDLIDEKEVKKIIKDFSKNIKSKVITLSTLEKSSVSKIKAQLISYAS